MQHVPEQNMDRENKKPVSEKKKRHLGLYQQITRRDFLNGLLIGTGAVLLDFRFPLACAASGSWDGYGGIGDYAESHGNTEEIVNAGHNLRDGKYQQYSSDVRDTGEVFDLAIIGSGMSGLAAAFSFMNATRKKRSCIILDNHPVFGGVSKRNEFSVAGYRMISPQGANSFSVIDDIFSELGMPRSFQYQNPAPASAQLQFDRTNFGFMFWKDLAAHTGHFFQDSRKGSSFWLADIWNQKMKGTPFSDEAKRDLLFWKNDLGKGDRENRHESWFDTMTYKEFLENVLKLNSAVTGFADPVLASSMGLGCDAISAYGAYQVALPGFTSFTGRERQYQREWHSFPGGTDGFVRYFIKRMLPEAIQGEDVFEDILNNPIRFSALEQKGSPVQIRLKSTVVEVRHDSPPEQSEYVSVAYVRDNTMFRLKAKRVIVTAGSWVAKRFLQDLPEDYRHALSSFYHSPFLVVNVGLKNWRFLEKLGVTACRWFEGFGFSCNLRQPMTMGDYQPPLDPGKPVILTFYVPFYYPGLHIREQGVRGRRELLSTSYAEYELMIREQMARLFSASGFDPRKDIAGIILNRWGHAYVNPQPGFYFGTEGREAPRLLLKRGFGRLAFCNAELNGHQHWAGAIREGRRAAKQVLGFSS